MLYIMVLIVVINGQYLPSVSMFKTESSCETARSVTWQARSTLETSKIKLLSAVCLELNPEHSQPFIQQMRIDGE